MAQLFIIYQLLSSYFPIIEMKSHKNLEKGKQYEETKEKTNSMVT